MARSLSHISWAMSETPTRTRVDQIMVRTIALVASSHGEVGPMTMVIRLSAGKTVPRSAASTSQVELDWSTPPIDTKSSRSTGAARRLRLCSRSAWNPGRSKAYWAPHSTVQPEGTLPL